MQDYMFMMRGSHAAFEAQSPAEKQAVMERYYAYVKRLKEEGRFKGGSALSNKSRYLAPGSGAGGVQVLDGPFPESKEALNGYFIVQAKSLEEAVEIGHDCPCLTHGETVEIIELTNH